MRVVVVASLVLAAACSEGRSQAPAPPPAEVAEAPPPDAALEDTTGWKEVQVRVLGMY